MKQLYMDLKQCIFKRKKYITQIEYNIIKKELTLFENLLSDNPKYSLQKIQTILANDSLPLYNNINECLQRIHEVSGIGSLPSCQSSANIIEALYDSELITPYEIKSSLFIGRGHIAPAIFALRYLKNGFPLSFLFSLYEVIPPVINKNWGFHYSMRHSLGEGLPMAVGKALISLKNNHKEHFFCFVGDGEMQEGISYEAVRIAYELNIKRFTLIIDANKRGIEKLNKPINLKYLNAFFDNVYVLDNNKNDIKKQLSICKQNALRDAIVCNTQKKYHSYKRDKKNNKTTSLEIGNILKKLKKYFKKIYVFTPDLSSRFGLSENIEYINTGLSEQATVGMLLSIDKQALKIVLTDDKYLFNSIDTLQSLFMNNSNILIIASRKNAIWGGPNNSPNIFSNLYGIQYYEICNPEHIEKIIFQNKIKNSNFFVSLWDDELNQIKVIEQYYNLIDNRYFISKKKNNNVLLISNEPFAIKIYEIHKFFKQTSHIRFLTNKPILTKQDIHMINKYKIIIVYEMNNEYNGLGQYLKSILLREIYIISLNTYSFPSLKERQDKLNEINIEKLKNKTKGIIDVYNSR